MSKIVKRFIAGAVCPKCAEQDVLTVYRIGDDEFRECVECGFEDKMVFKSQMRELGTRVNTTEEEIASETRVVTLMPSKPNKK